MGTARREPAEPCPTGRRIARRSTGDHGAGFTLVLAGGGARGYAHVGVLRALEFYGLAPTALVGVSMGGIVAVTYALRADWYSALLESRAEPFPDPSAFLRVPSGPFDGVRLLARRLRAIRGLLHGWGPANRSAQHDRRALRAFTRGRRLEEGRVPVAVCATDLRSGERVVLRSGDAADAAYASSALAGILAPLSRGRSLLADGAYADLAPIDVARALGEPVIVVDPGQLAPAGPVQNGLQAIVRAAEICHRHHAELRFGEAHLVLRPPFCRPIDALEFHACRECVAAGVRAVRGSLTPLRTLLGPSPGRRRLVGEKM
jgi:NTE family protein